MEQNRKKEKREIATEYYCNNFNCSQAVFTTFAVEEGIPEELALKIATQFGGEFMSRFVERNGTVVCRELLGYDLTKPEDKEKIRELGLFQKMCPKMVQSATEIVEKMLAESVEG